MKVLFILFITLLANLQGRDLNIYVSPQGSDEHGSGSKAKPWKTITKARDSIRQQKLIKKTKGSVIINLKAGSYPINNTIYFGVQDSGKHDAPVILRSVDGPAKAVVTSGQNPLKWKMRKGDRENLE